jgi:hypothetical protein
MGSEEFCLANSSDKINMSIGNLLLIGMKKTDPFNRNIYMY